MRVHIISESEFTGKGNGVHTAFIDHIELLRSQNELDLTINEDGWGDILHSHTYGPYYFLKGLTYRKKRILTVHVIPDSIKGSIPLWKIMMPLVKLYFKQVYSYADVCIAISPMVEKAIKDTGVKTEIVRISNPINLEKWKTTAEKRKQGREMLGLNENEFVVLGVGQLQARKGVEDFIDIAKAIPEARFVWAGGRPFKCFTEGISRIDERISQADNNMIFTGMLDLDQMPLIYSAADIMLFPSYQENCPLAPIEGAAANLPVVFRDLPEYKSLYEHEYLKADTTDDFIRITKNLMNDKEFYQKGSIISKQLTVQFDKETIRLKLMNLYERINESDSSKNINYSLDLNEI